jgi:hypothetical protein
LSLGVVCCCRLVFASVRFDEAWDGLAVRDELLSVLGRAFLRAHLDTVSDSLRLLDDLRPGAVHPMDK